MTITLRPATLADAQFISVVFCEGCHSAYDATLPSSFTERYTPSQQLDRFASRLESLPSNEIFLLAVDSSSPSDNGGVVGFIDVGPKEVASRTSSLADALPSKEENKLVGEVHYIFVRPSYGGKGVGKMLMKAGEEYMFSSAENRQERFKSAVVKVLADNEIAVRFYEKYGWRYMTGKDTVFKPLVESGEEFIVRWYEKEG